MKIKIFTGEEDLMLTVTFLISKFYFIEDLALGQSELGRNQIFERVIKVFFDNCWKY